MSDYTLYTYFRSSCSGRLRIAFNLKNLEFKPVYINLLQGEQSSDKHRALNPSCTVPLVICHNDADLRIGQSVPAIEYLDEKHPDISPLVPKDSTARTMVRVLTNIVSCDIQPVTNLRILQRVRALNASAEQWNIDLISEGLSAYEAIAKTTAGKYSVGDEVTIADVCLMPAIWSSERFNMSLDAYPSIKVIVANLNKLPAIINAHPFRQPDCPEELRVKE